LNGLTQKKSLCYKYVTKPYELFSSSVDLLSKSKETRQPLRISSP